MTKWRKDFRSATADYSLRIVELPVLISHTGPGKQLEENASMGNMVRPGLINREGVKVIADADGITGV